MRCSPNAEPLDESETGAGPIRVLFISGNKDFAGAIADLLSRHPDVILLGAFPAQGHSPAWSMQPDVVLVDLDLPNQAGMKIVRRAREHLPRVGIVALASFKGVIYRRVVLGAGCDALVAKARATTELLPTIQRVASGPRA